jgi:hypothetical protein
MRAGIRKNAQHRNPRASIMTDEEFSDWWGLLKNNLEPRTPIRHWSAMKGYLSGSFDASPGPYISHECVQIEGPRQTHIYQRLIFAGDFRRVLDVWDDYRAGQIPRREIDRLTKHSTYVLPIIHWLEERAK